MADRFAYARTYERLYRLGYHAKKDYSHARSICDRVADGMIPATSALDVGCSTGWAVRRLGELGLRASGVDVAATAVRRGRAAGLDLHVASATSLPFDDDAFELVLSTDCFEHLHPDDVEAAVAEAVRVSSDWLAFKINPRTDRNRWWKLLAGSPLHLTTQPLEWWVERFEDAGAELIELDGAEEELILRVPAAARGTSDASADRRVRTPAPA
jgi:SAM-dependent methyltransferase